MGRNGCATSEPPLFCPSSALTPRCHHCREEGIQAGREDPWVQAYSLHSKPLLIQLFNNIFIAMGFPRQRPVEGWEMS